MKNSEIAAQISFETFFYIYSRGYWAKQGKRACRIYEIDKESFYLQGQIG